MPRLTGAQEIELRKVIDWLRKNKLEAHVTLNGSVSVVPSRKVASNA